MEVTATAKNVRISPEKMRLVVDQIKKMPPTKALQILDFIHKSTAPVLKKVINSAIANAKHNFGLAEESLVFKEISVGKGPMFKRSQPIARGRVHQILKRTSHIKVVLEGKQKNRSKDQQKKGDTAQEADAKRPTTNAD